MNIFQHSRFAVFNQNQHPLQHDVGSFIYSNPGAPGVTDVSSALNYLFAVVYPNSKPAVANVAALPLVGNTINDFRVVNDDGDGKAAAYRWEQRETEASPSWHKVFDVDWGSDSILQAWQNRTQDLFVMRYGYDDLDNSGTAVVGTFAGQRIFGGKSANTNLTLSANSGDGVGADTGFVQTTDHFRPTVDNSLSLGTTGSRWLKGWFYETQIGTLNLQAGSIVDSSGAIDFGNNDLSTSGTGVFGTLTVGAASIVDSSGSLSFGATDLTSTGFLTISHVVAVTAPSSFFAGTTVANFTFTDGNIASASPAVDFNALNLTTTGAFTGGQANIDNLRLDGNTLSVTAVNGNLILSANGSGSILTAFPFTISAALAVSSANFQVTNGTAIISGTGAFLQVDNLKLDGNTLSTENANGNLLIVPNGTGLTSFASGIFPTGSYDIGKTGSEWNKLWISGSIGGATEITIADLLTLRSINYRDAGRTLPAQSGDAAFYNGSIWLASAPDTEITHSSLSGLTTGDAGHTQFALLAGRSGGQSLIGGVAASENLNLESTSHVTKGFLQFKDTARPFTTAAYSGGWSGADLGDATHLFRHIYTAGEFFGLRLENLGALPSPSTQNIGRLVFLTTDSNVYVDTGTTLQQVGSQRTVIDTSWDGVTSVKNVTVSGPDARTVDWTLKDNTNDFEAMYVSIKSTSATNVRITVGTPLPAGSYRLIGV